MPKLFPNPVNTESITVSQHYGLLVLAIDLAIALATGATVVALMLNPKSNIRCYLPKNSVGFSAAAAPPKKTSNIGHSNSSHCA